MTDTSESVAKAPDPLAIAIGQRIGEAMHAAHIRTTDELARRLETSERSVRRWTKGHVCPQPAQLLLLSHTLRVSVDWLLSGRDETPAAYAEWLETPMGRSAEEEARAFLRRLPTYGYRATTKFYDFAYLAWRDGLGAEIVAKVAQDTDRLRGK